MDPGDRLERPTAMCRAIPWEAWCSLGRAAARRVLLRVTVSRNGAGRRLSRAPFSAQVERGALRPLRPEDRASWCQARRANDWRMREWWWEGRGPAAPADDEAFSEHLLSAWAMRMKGSGLILVFDDGSGVVGELTANFSCNGRVAEVGLWRSPNSGLSRQDVICLIAALIDDLMLVRGVERIQAPVATENHQPEPILRTLGALEEGIMAKSRPLGSKMIDMRFFGLTTPRWLEHRETLMGTMDWGQPDDVPAASLR